MNSQDHTGRPTKPIDDKATLSAPTIEPVTLGGWYACKDGSSAHFEWIGGRLTLLEVHRPLTFAAVGSNGDRLVIWGLGATAEAALIDASTQDFGGDEFRPSFEVAAIDPLDAQRIRFGSVGCSIVDGRVVLER